MATTICESLLASDIQGYRCDNPMVKGVENIGVLINRSDINMSEVVKEANGHVISALPLKKGKKGYTIMQSGKTPFNGTQQEMAEGTYLNTVTNTLQFVILNNGVDTAKVVDALMNGIFVAVLTNKYAPEPDFSHQVFGIDSGLHASAMVRELYNDDTLAGWLVTLTEEEAGIATWYLPDTIYATLTETAD